MNLSEGDVFDFDPKFVSPVLLRLIQEVRREQEQHSRRYDRVTHQDRSSGSYNRVYNRHMGG